MYYTSKISLKLYVKEPNKIMFYSTHEFIKKKKKFVLHTKSADVCFIQVHFKEILLYYYRVSNNFTMFDN